MTNTMTAKEDRISQVENARKMLMEHVFNKTNKVYFIVRSVSKSGMSRKIDFYAFVENPDKANDVQKWYLTGYFDLILNNGKRTNTDGGMRVNGCGMDMGFHIVQNVSICLFCPDKYEQDKAYFLKSEQL